MVSTDPAKYFRFTFSRNGQGTENYFNKAETACAKTDNIYRLFQSALAGEKALSVTVKNDTTLNVDFESSSNVQEGIKFTVDVGNKKPVL